MGFVNRLIGLFRQSRLEQDLNEELQHHIELKTQENTEAGMSPEEARYEALRAFGGVEQKKEECREADRLPWVGDLVQDLRYGLRQLRRYPGFAAITIVTLALGIASTVAIFGFVDSALIRPLPYPKPSRLMGVFKTSPLCGQQCGYSYPDYLDLERFNSVFASLATYRGDKDLVLSEAGSVQQVYGVGVTSNFFRILGVAPILGRDFAARPASEDLQAARSTVILSYAAWQKWFGGRSHALGKTVTLNGESYTVIGVLPRSFQFAPTGATEFWTTLRPYAGDSCHFSRGCMEMGVIARLKDGVSLQQALGDVKAIASQEAKQYPDPDRKRGANIIPLSQAILGEIQPILLAVLGGAGLLLLIA
jgi:macrolide transport system ATP-binding/permease protein